MAAVPWFVKPRSRCKLRQLPSYYAVWHFAVCQPDVMLLLKGSQKPRAQFRLLLRSRSKIDAAEDETMREKCSVLPLVLILVVLATAGCERLTRPNVSGVWKGTIAATDNRGHKWNGPAELTLNQNGDAIAGTLSFTHPQGGRVQVPISSGVVSKSALTFSGQNQFPMGSLEITFHGNVTGASLTGTADMTSRSLLIGPQTNTASLNLRKQ
jgi:hypothetical protein